MHANSIQSVIIDQERSVISIYYGKAKAAQKLFLTTLISVSRWSKEIIR